MDYDVEEREVLAGALASYAQAYEANLQSLAEKGKRFRRGVKCLVVGLIWTVLGFGGLMSNAGA